MADIRIERDKAERIIALILREEKKMLSSEANELAGMICSRLQSAMAMPTKPRLRGYKMIQGTPPYDKRTDFTTDVALRLADVDEYTAAALWAMVYKYGRNIPDDIVL